MSHHRRWVLGIAAGYGLAGVLWIALSDRFLATLTADPAFLTRLQTMKGWFFIRVWAESAPGEGATFYLELPV